LPDVQNTTVGGQRVEIGPLPLLGRRVVADARGEVAERHKPLARTQEALGQRFQIEPEVMASPGPYTVIEVKTVDISDNTLCGPH
jgi:hypothetical protein